MLVYVTRDGQQYGPYSVSELQRQLESGALNPGDLGWYDGAPDWKPLGSILGMGIGPAPRQVAPRLSIAQPGYNSGASGPTPKPSGLAIASMILGILSVVLCFAAFLSLIMGVLAAIFGHVSRGQILRSNGQITGGGMALTGIITGYVGICASLLFLWAYACVFFAGYDAGYNGAADQSRNR